MARGLLRIECTVEIKIIRYEIKIWFNKTGRL